MNLLRYWLYLLVRYMDDTAARLAAMDESIEACVYVRVCSVFNRSRIADSTYDLLESTVKQGVLREDKLDSKPYKMMKWLNDIVKYGRPMSDEQCFTYDTLKYNRVLSERELRTAVKSNFVHRDGYIDIDIVLVEQQSRFCVPTLALLLSVVPVVFLTSDLTTLAYLGNLSSMVLSFTIIFMIVTFLVCASFTCLTMYRVYLTGILPVKVARTIYEKRNRIEKLGPRCVFITNKGMRNAY